MLISTLRFILPFSYVLASRLTTPRTWVSLLGFEWAPIALLLWYLGDISVVELPLFFALAYVAFISIYEIGYLANDVISIRFEDDPRQRLPDFQPANAQLILWVLTRLATFTTITWYLQMLSDWQWWGFYASLALIFSLHNIITNYGLRVPTFVGLAMSRILAPIFPFLEPSDLSLIFLPLFLNYALFRTLAYMDSKDLLTLPGRQSPTFRIGFYLILLPLSLMLSALAFSPIPLAINAYYLVFWLSLSAAALLFSSSTPAQ